MKQRLSLSHKVKLMKTLPVPPPFISGGAAAAGAVGAGRQADAAGQGAGVQQHGLQEDPELWQAVRAEQGGEFRAWLGCTAVVKSSLITLTYPGQIVEMQQVVIEDREEEERLQQQEELARTAAKVGRVPGSVDSGPTAYKMPVQLISHH